MGIRLRALQSALGIIQTRTGSRESLLVEASYDLRLKGVLELQKVNCVLDVGANRGQFARRLRASGYSGWIVSFEPIPHLFADLQAMAAADGKWRVHQIALGRAPGRATLHVSARDDFSSFLHANKITQDEFGVGRHTWRDVEVEVQRVEDNMSGMEEILRATPRFFLKLDTQGFDLEVFAGLGSWRERLVGLQSELSVVPIYDHMPDMQAALQIYQEAGYSISGLFPVSVERATGRVIEFDCIMVRHLST